MRRLRIRIAAAAAALVLTTGAAALAAPTTIIVRPRIVVPPGPYAMDYCTTACGPHYAIWNGRMSCSPGGCICGCVRPNNAGPIPRFYQLY